MANYSWAVPWWVFLACYLGLPLTCSALVAGLAPVCAWLSACWRLRAVVRRSARLPRGARPPVSSRLLRSAHWGACLPALWRLRSAWVHWQAGRRWRALGRTGAQS